MDLETILGLGGVVAEAAVVLLCIRAKLFRTTPVFFYYLLWSTLVDIAFNVVARYYYPAGVSVGTYLAELIIDSVFQLAVLVELEWSVLRPIRGSLPKQSIVILAFLVLALGAIIWPVTRWALPPHLTHTGKMLVQLQQTVAALRVVFFMAIAGFSQMLAIGWRNRELQIATGLGFYSMFSLAIAVIHAHQLGGQGVVVNNQLSQSVGHTYHILDILGTASYVCSLLYWVVSFAQKEEARQEFTPQMRSFLLAVAGAARGTRMALADSTMPGPKAHKP